MERKNEAAVSWLDTAVGGIRFGPDRAAVREELEAHMEDKAADLQRIFPGISREEAEERALSEMGDPAEIGKELARVHKPWRAGCGGLPGCCWPWFSSPFWG